MRFRLCLGYAVYPLVAVLLFFAPSVLRAQDNSGQAIPGASSSSQVDQNRPPVQQQSQVLREAQARVNARRQLRIQQLIKQTYSHKYELEFSGNYARFIPGRSLARVNEPGWQIDLTDYFHTLNGKLGISADVRGYYGTAYTGTNPYSVYNPGISEYTFMAGPRYRFYGRQRWSWTAFVLGGIGHNNFGTGTNGLPPQYVGLYTNTNSLYVDAGASADYNMSAKWAVRWTGDDQFSSNSGFQDMRGGALGLLYRFGKK